MNIDIKDFIRGYLKKENVTLTELVSLINKNRTDNDTTTLQNLSNKLARGTIKFSEVLEIANILGYNIVFEKINSSENQLFSTYSHDNLDCRIENEVKKFTAAVLNKILNVENDIKTKKQKSEVESLKNDIHNLSMQLIYIKYYDFFYTQLLMCHDGNEFIPAVTLIRNIYLHGGFQNLSSNYQKELCELFESLRLKQAKTLKKIHNQ